MFRFLYSDNQVKYMAKNVQQVTVLLDTPSTWDLRLLNSVFYRVKCQNNITVFSVPLKAV